MSISSAIDLLKNFAGKHSFTSEPHIEEVNELTPGDFEVLYVSNETYDKAAKLVDDIAFPVTINYVADDGEDELVHVVLREIRRYDANTFLMKAEYEGNGRRELLSTDRMRELYAGEYGRQYGRNTTMTSPAEDALFKAGKKILGGFGWNVQDGKAVIPHFTEFFRLFEIYQNDKYKELRLQLHTMAFLARLDKRYCDQECRIISQLINLETSGASDHDKALLATYAAYSFITQQAFVDAIEALDLLPLSHVTNLLDKTRALIESDGKITPEEDKLFNQLKTALMD